VLAVADDRANALATSIMSAVTCNELLDVAIETAALLDDPAPLPPFDAGVRVIYRRLMLEHRANERLRSRLRRMLAAD
jgi:hypothetical protein